uniref:Uncharacterized protein n=1 Tax=Oryza barthii TaxID=65489 RepID=A0A0D3G5F3_9ORYZ
MGVTQFRHFRLVPFRRGENGIIPPLSRLVAAFPQRNPNPPRPLSSRIEAATAAMTPPFRPSPSAGSIPRGCGGDRCASGRDAWPLHHVRHDGVFCRLCSSCRSREMLDAAFRALEAEAREAKKPAAAPPPKKKIPKSSEANRDKLLKFNAMQQPALAFAAAAAAAASSMPLSIPSSREDKKPVKQEVQGEPTLNSIKMGS